MFWNINCTDSKINSFKKRSGINSLFLSIQYSSALIPNVCGMFVNKLTTSHDTKVEGCSKSYGNFLKKSQSSLI